MKKILFLIPIAMIFLFAPAAFAGTPFLSGSTLQYSTSTNNTTYFSSGTATSQMTDGNTATYRTMANNSGVTGSFGGKRLIDGWSMRHFGNYGTLNFRLILYASNLVVVYDSTIATTQNSSASIPQTSAYFFKLINISGAQYSVSEFDLTSTPDLTAPDSPTITSATGGNLSVTINWTKPPQTDLAGYKIYRNGVVILNLGVPNQLTYTDTGLTPGTTYTYAVSAYDDWSPANESPTSATASATATDTVSPTQPIINLTSPGDNTVTLQWSASTDNHQVSGYRIKRNGTQIATVTGNSYTATGLTNGTSYTFTVEAYDTVPNYSTAASVTSTPVDNIVPIMPTLTAGTIGETTIEVKFFDSSSSDVTVYHLSKNNFTSFEMIPDNNSSVYSYTFTGLASNTTYTFSGISFDDDGNGSTTKTVTLTTAAVPPATPTGLTVTPGDNTLTYSWNANSESDIAGYKIKLSTAATATNVSINSYEFTGLVNGVQSCYQVAAYDIWGNTSGYSAAVCGTPSDNVNPDAPVLTATAGNLSISLSWTTPQAADLSYYRIYKIVSGSPVLDYTLPNASVNTKNYPTAYNVTGTYAVTAVDDDGNESVLSNVVSSTAVDTIPPSQPTSLSAAAGDRSVYLTWTASTDNNVVSGYQVIYQIVNDNGQTIATTTATNYTATGLTNNETYGFSVKAYDPAGNLSAEAYVESTPMDTVNPDMKPLQLDTKTETSVTLTFDDSLATDVVKYTITRNDFTTSYDITDTNATDYQYTFFGLNGNTAYTFKIKATDDDNNVSVVKTLTVTTAAVPPSTPTGLTVTELDNKLSFTWDAVTDSDLAGYKLYRVSTGNVVATTTATAADVTGLVNGVQSCYQVAAYDIWNNLSSMSAAVCGTPIDLIPPFDVTTITSTGSTEYSYTFSWDDSTSADVDYYKIYKDTIHIANVDDVPGETSYSYTATGLTPGVNYAFNVNPVDDDGLEAFPGTSGTITATTNAVPPNAPTGLVGSPGTDKINFSWSANSEPDLAGYKLFKVTGTSYVLVNSYNSNVTTAEIGSSDPTAYSYVLAAYDHGGTISAYSNVVTVAPISSTAPLFAGITSPVAAGDIVESGFSLVSLLSWFFLIGIVIWLVAKLIPLVRFSAIGGTNPNEAQPLPETKSRTVDKETMNRIRRKRKQDIELRTNILSRKDDER